MREIIIIIARCYCQMRKVIHRDIRGLLKFAKQASGRSGINLNGACTPLWGFAPCHAKPQRYCAIYFSISLSIMHPFWEHGSQPGKFLKIFFSGSSYKGPLQEELDIPPLYSNNIGHCASLTALTLYCYFLSPTRV